MSRMALQEVEKIEGQVSHSCTIVGMGDLAPSLFSKPGSIVIPALSRDPVADESRKVTGFPFMPETSICWFYGIFLLK